MRRREFIAGLGAAAMPFAARAQQGGRMRRVGVLMPHIAGNPQAEARIAAFLAELERLGWAVGGNVTIDYRWSASVTEETRKHAAELAALAPDVIFSSGSGTLGPLLQATRSVPIVFAIVPDPVGAGFVESLARPGGNATGFMTFEPGISAKWLEMLKELVPGMKRAAVLRDPTITGGIGMWSSLQTVAPSLGVELRAIDMRNASEIERAITEFARIPNAGIVVTGGGLAVIHRDLFIALAARHKLPTMYYDNFFTRSGGLISYGPDYPDQYRRARQVLGDDKEFAVLVWS